MDRETLKGYWTVQAGVIPGHPDPELSRRWYYSSREYEQDRASAEVPDYTPNFTIKMLEAKDYWLQMNNPARLNWALLDFYWV